MPLDVLKMPEHADLLSIEPLRERTVGVIGYGNQGSAHALNLRDCGINVRVANRLDSPNARRAVDDGFVVESIAPVVSESDLVIIALPDEAHHDVFRQDIELNLRDSATIGFLHGFSVRFSRVVAPPGRGVVLVAPKGPGATLRSAFTRGQGIPCLFAVHQESIVGDSQLLGLAWATAIGCARAGVIRTTFAEEAETDLFGEQTVLCGGMLYLMLAAWETMVEAGYSPELAYIECCHEIKQVADLLYARGPAGMCEAISNTAEFGAHVAGPRMVPQAVRAAMREALEAIQCGRFSDQLASDYQLGFPWFQEQRKALRAHPIEPASAVIRAMMPWLEDRRCQTASEPGTEIRD